MAARPRFWACCKPLPLLRLTLSSVMPLSDVAPGPAQALVEALAASGASLLANIRGADSTFAFTRTLGPHGRSRLSQLLHFSFTFSDHTRSRGLHCINVSTSLVALWLFFQI